MKLNVQRYLKCRLGHLASLLWAEHKFISQLNRFNEGREDVYDDACTGRSSMSTDENIEAVKKMISDNHWINIKEVADVVGITFGLCQAFFTDVAGMKRVIAKIIPKC